MYSKWITQITEDNLTALAEYCARYGLLSRDEIERAVQSHAENGEDSYLLVFAPEDRTRVNMRVVDGKEVKERYILIPVYHPEGHFQQFELNH
jgi:hypothetical protein